MTGWQSFLSWFGVSVGTAHENKCCLGLKKQKTQNRKSKIIQPKYFLLFLCE